jgi:phospholipase/carboxylesterase
MTDSILVQQPSTPAKQLFLLFHGVGATPQALLPVAHALAQAFPEGLVVSVAAPFDSDLGAGRQWFSARGITEENRLPRIQEAMPLFTQVVQHWQGVARLSAAETALVGFSQGAIMALQASTHEPAIAARVVAHSGRYAVLPDHAPSRTTLHLIHGKQDAVIEYRHCVEAAHRLQSLGADFTADVLPFLGHQLSDESLALVISNLKQHVPQHAWASAMEVGCPPLKPTPA